MPPPKIRVFIDRGGTFTDCIAFVPRGDGGSATVVIKLLSEDPGNYADAPTEAIRRILERASGRSVPRNAPLDTSNIELIRMGTTVATNALLERKGERVALLVTKGFKDILHIQNQARPKIFDLQISMPGVLYEEVVEVDERVSLVGYTAHPKGVISDDQIQKGDLSYVKGVTGEWVHILKKPDLAAVRASLESIRAKRIHSISICFMHSFTFPAHEQAVASLAAELGFTNISVSSALAPTIKLVPRGNSATTDAYLTPSIRTYLTGFKAGFDAGIMDGRVRVQFMKSDGGLADVNDFSGLGAILSGPAGGVVGYALTSYDPDEGTAIIGFDMGGTSTDVSRYAGRYDHVFETTTAGITIQAPQLDINTVAAGGGSRLFYRNGMFAVGPESAGANPGPTCYKKGGPLAITDANLLLGRLLPSYFPKIFGPTEKEPLDLAATSAAFSTLSQQINQSDRPTMSLDEIAYGFVEVANEAMCRPIRQLTQAKGHDTARHVLACFGGAGGQHACAIAKRLGIRTILIHRHSAILSAYGLALADVVHEVQEPCQQTFDLTKLDNIRVRIAALSKDAQTHLTGQGFKDAEIVIEPYLNLRYQGTDTSMMTLKPEGDSWDFLSVFVATHKQEFGFILPDRPVIVDDIRIRAIGKGATAGAASGASVHKEVKNLPRRRVDAKTAKSIEQTYWAGMGRCSTPVFVLSDLVKGDELSGPALIIDVTATIVVEPQCTALVTSEHVVILVESSGKKGSQATRQEDVDRDPIMLSVFGHRFMSIAEQMGRTLQKTAISTNIKERLDFSCALFGPDGGLVANAPHIPVHLGSMQEAVRWQMQHLAPGEIRDGDVLLTNHPAAGGSHLPDITVITPVFSGGKLVFFVASRGHHADIGGIQPGSMPPNSTELFQEGAAVKSFHLVRGGVFDEAGVTDILLHQPARFDGCSGTRCLSDNLSDLKAQVAANQRGIALVQGLIGEYGLHVVQAYMHYIRENAEMAVRNMLMEVAKSSGSVLHAEDFMDDGSAIKLAIKIDPRDGSAVFDFTGTATEVYANTNAPRSVSYSAIIYCLRCLINLDMPLNQGALQPIDVIIPEGSMLSPSENAAVVGGNVLTSQRLCDVVLKAFGACAASQGCCNNFTFGSGGKDKDGNVTDGFGYYETIAGGSGAGRSWNGRSGVHTHMTNTRITDPEILERRYPVLLRQFGLRANSGGDGLFKGGDGVVREIEFLEPLTVSMLSERRVFRPYGLAGGEPGSTGLNLLQRKGQKAVNFGGKNATLVHPGDVITILTPGGGGYGVKGTKRKAVDPDEAGASRLGGGSLGAMEEAQRDF
ncbi:Hydantoinase B/oxoprolinase-domain-containing protein [Chytriomyces sp. MP71]|nr:Hydantoinase B/oxoprolinase-domain-containing protein [Chytriomyces sp. MP71]